MNPIKLGLARGLDALRVHDALLRGQRLATRWIRAVNYHDVPAALAPTFQEQLRYYRERFADVTYDDLRGFLDRGTWNKDRPGLILSFDDGLASHAEIVAPMLEAHGFTGWFFVSPGLLGTVTPTDHYLTVDQLKRLAAKHVVGCHTMHHVRLAASLTDAQRHEEIVASKGLLEGMIGREVDIFCWVGGEETSYSREAAASVRSAGYRYSFMTNTAPIFPTTHPLQLQRTNVEASLPMSVLKFQLSGLMDLYYVPKRLRVDRLTA